jgi:hypothetical protein
MLTWAKPYICQCHSQWFLSVTFFPVVEIKYYKNGIVLEKADLHDGSNTNKINKLANYFRMTL